MNGFSQRCCSLLPLVLLVLLGGCSTPATAPDVAAAKVDAAADQVAPDATVTDAQADVAEQADQVDTQQDMSDAATPADALTDTAGPDAADAPDLADSQDGADAPDEADAPDLPGDVSAPDTQDAADTWDALDTADTQDAGGLALPPATLGFVAAMSGKFAVVDLSTMTKLADIGQGHQHVHGMGTAPGQKVAYVPNPDNGTIDRYEQVGGPSNWVITATWTVGLQMGMLDASPDGKFLAMTAGNMVIKMPNGGMPNFSKDIVIFDTSLGKPIAKLQTVSPNPIAITADGATAWVGNWLDHTISKINVGTAAEVATVALPTTGPDANWVGPTRVTLSPDENWLLSCDLGDKVAVLMPSADPTKQVVLPVGDLAHWCEFSPDSKTFAVTTWDHLIDEGDEVANTKIPSATLVFDRATQKQIAKLTWKFLMVHNGFAPGTPWLYVTASYGNVLRYDASYQLTGQLPVTGGEPMPVMTISF